jgi:hypothetical protein
MKKIICGLLTALVLSGLFPVNVFAAESSEKVTVISKTETVLEDGSTIIEMVFQDSPLLQSFSAAGSRTGGKTVKYIVENGVVSWTVTVAGAFFYTGTSSRCVDAKYSYSINAVGWSLVSGKAYCSINQAIATATFRNSFGVTQSKRAILTCDNNGNLS